MGGQKAADRPRRGFMNGGSSTRRDARPTVNNFKVLFLCLKEAGCSVRTASAFFILYLESYISRLNEILRHDLTLSVGEPDNAAAKQGQELRSDWVRWSSLQAYAIRSFSSAVTRTLMMCVFRFRGVSLRFSRACTFGLFISVIFDLL